MTEDKKKLKLTDAAATIINGLIGGVFGIIVALIGVGFFPFLNPGLQEAQNQNAELQAQLSRTIPAPKNSDIWTDNGRTHRYWVCQGFPDWDKAEAFCETLGGHLVTITSLEEQAHVQNYVKETAPKTCLWIGIQRNNGNWNQWTSGEKFEYANWGGPYPTMVNKDDINTVFSNYEKLGGEDYEMERGQWFQLYNQGVEKLNPDGWLICEWDYD